MSAADQPSESQEGSAEQAGAPAGNGTPEPLPAATPAPAPVPAPVMHAETTAPLPAPASLSAVPMSEEVPAPPPLPPSIMGAFDEDDTLVATPGFTEEHTQERNHEDEPLHVLPGAENAQEGAPAAMTGEGLALRDVLSDERLTFDEPAPLDLPPPPGEEPPEFSPPSIPGIRSEVTKPLRGLSGSGESAAPTELPQVVAAPESSRRSDSTDALLEDLGVPGGHLSEKTVDLDIGAALHTREMRSLSDPATDDSMTVEGAPFEDGTAITALPPPPGGSLKADNGASIQLEESLGDQRGCVFYRAKIDLAPQAFTAVWSPDPRPEPPWTHLPDPRLVRPRARASLDGASVRVFERPKGNTVVDYLTDPNKQLPAMATLELGIELAEILESLHGAGQCILDLDPSQIVIERGGRVRFYGIGGFLAAGQVPQGAVGIFAAPEVRRRYSYLVGAHSDVYSVALMLYALLARRAPIEPDLDPALIAAPRVFRPECPLGIWPYLKPCLEPVPGKRVGHARGLRENLVAARSRLLHEARAVERPEPIILESWAEVHTGLGKARRGAPQQDRAFAKTADEGNVGLYVVGDGVSRSKYGDGAYAAEQVKISAEQRWGALEKAGGDALRLSHAQRIDVLRQISRSAGKRIAAEVNTRCAPMPNEPNQVMSTTIVAAYIVGSEATVACLGDSRVYLVRDGTIERISIDHDRATDALRMGLGFKEAAEVKMGSALTRVVGRVVIDQEGHAHPDPFEPEIFRTQLLPDDRLVLCSDGIPDFAAGAGADQYTAELKMLDVVLEHEDPARAAYELVVLANRGGGYDNISCIVVAAHPG
jgi:serine/threonine protein phosphatase PrpC